MNVLITGGTGFIGYRLALHCLERGDAVKILGQENTPAETANRELIEREGAQIVLGSVTDIPELKDLFDGVDVVFHLAATQHEMNVPDQQFWDVNVEGTRHVFEGAIAAGVKRVVHGSTIGVYGVPTTVVTEKTECEPDNIYGVTKLEGEKLALSFKDKIGVAAIRIPEVYGPGDQRLVKLFRGISKNVFFMIGCGQNMHHVIYIDDLVTGFLQAAEHPNVHGDVFLLAGKEPVTTDQMVGTVAKVLGCPFPRIRAPMLPFLVTAFVMEKALRPFGIQPPLHRRRLDFFRKTFTLCSQKSMDTFGFDPRVGFTEGAKRTAAYYQKMGYL